MGHLFAAVPQSFHESPIQTPPSESTINPVRHSFRLSSTTDTFRLWWQSILLLSLPLFYLSSHIYIHCHLSPRQRLPFFSNMLGPSLFLSCLKTSVQLQNPSPFQFVLSISLSPYSFPISCCKTRMHTHTWIWNSYQSLWGKYNINFKHWHRHWKKHNYSCCTNTHKGLWSKIISWLHSWPQTSGQFLMEPGDFTVCMLPFHIPCCLSCFVNLTRILEHCHLHIRYKKKF